VRLHALKTTQNVNVFTYIARFHQHRVTYPDPGATIMITLSHAQHSGTKAKRFTISSDVRAIVYTIAIISAVTVAPFALLGQHFAPNVAKDLRHQSEMLSQAGDPAGAAAASRRAVDIYRGLMRARVIHYAPQLAASLHDLSIRLSEVGDDAGALAAIHEAVELRRHLAKYSSRDAASLEQSLQLLSQTETREASRIKITDNAR
jgi:Tetratricopeptide repeat